MKEYKRNCPICNKELKYVNAQSYCGAKKRNTWCYQCRKKEMLSDPEYRQKLQLVCEDNKKRFSGEGNPFYGKKHSNETKEKLRKNAFILKGKNNPCYGKSVYDWWLEKHGKEIADQKLYEYKKKQSIKSAGKNNPMYGKPAPQGSGNGWSGWYNGWFFRSLHELSYFIKVIERFNLKWETGEQKKYLIPYIDWNGKQRNYFCDFVINEKYLVECKPKKLHGSVSVQCKVKGAKEFCSQNDFKYKLISPRMLTEYEIKNLHDINKIQFLKQYERKFKEKYSNCEPAFGAGGR